MTQIGGAYVYHLHTLTEKIYSGIGGPLVPTRNLSSDVLLLLRGETQNWCFGV